MEATLVGRLLLLHCDEQGQGLVEYLLILAVISFGAAAGMTSIAAAVNSAFTAMANIVGQYIS